MAAIPDTGRLEEISLPRILVDLYRAQFDGRVELGRQRVEYTFLLASGVPVGCESPANKNGLCDQLLAAGTIAEADRDRAVSLIESKGCKEASALLELGLLDPRGLVTALRDQVRIHLLECMAWPKGAFTLDAGQPPAEAANPFRVDVFAVSQVGIESHWRADQVLVDLEPKIARFASKTDRFSSILERLEPDDALAAFANALDGKHSFWDALKLATTPKYPPTSNSCSPIMRTRRRKAPLRAKTLGIGIRNQSNPKLRLDCELKSRRNTKNFKISITTNCSVLLTRRRMRKSRSPTSRPRSAITPMRSQKQAST
jgi:hypothetical protein